MKRYNPKEIEPRWQKIWADDKAYVAVDYDTREKFYISPMFPYPSGTGMHTGHAFEHAIVDTVARFQRAHGRNVLNPMGWDAFGLPTENYAIKTGISPVEATQTFIANFKKQITRIGSSIDWSREINTSDPEYYKWTQWIFTQLFERGLAYQKESAQWWCPVDKTVLANEQVENGRCWRCGNEVVKKNLKQWFFKITDYADALLAEIPDLDWPEKIKVAQTNWIGRSQGAMIDFRVESEKVTVFTTRPDTIFGATFLVLAPEHPSVAKITTPEQKTAVDEYVKAAQKKSEIERQENKQKTGVFTGAYAVNPATNENIPVWIADYVLAGYGTGAIMAVPAHDERDREFAKAFELPVKSVVDSGGHDEGMLIDSGDFTGQSTSDARENIVKWLAEKGVAQEQTNYKMRDWLISRQRYWGAPIPIIHCPEHGAVAVPASDLPVILPEVKDITPDGSGTGVLARETDWVNTTCPTCGKPAKRETDTMDGYACSSWYLLRYTDPQNAEAAWDPKKADYWTPIDMYVGGDHAVAHLLYVRFWSHVFYDMGLVPTKEPVKKLVYHGYINAEDGTKMSKSKGNVIDPLEVIDSGYGADALRIFLLFLGPISDNSSWSANGIGGVYRFLNRIWTLVQEYNETDGGETDNTELERLIHRTVKKVTSDVEELSFNTAIAALMECVNELYKIKAADNYGATEWQWALETLTQLIAPFAPHIAEELWEQLGGDGSVHVAEWPTWDDKLLVEETVTVAVQVNGKLRGTITIYVGDDEAKAVELAKADEKIAVWLEGNIVKTIYVPNKLLNFVVK